MTGKNANQQRQLVGLKRGSVLARAVLERPGLGANNERFTEVGRQLYADACAVAQSVESAWGGASDATSQRIIMDAALDGVSHSWVAQGRVDRAELSALLCAMLRIQVPAGPGATPPSPPPALRIGASVYAAILQNRDLIDRADVDGVMTAAVGIVHQAAERAASAYNVSAEDKPSFLRALSPVFGELCASVLICTCESATSALVERPASERAQAIIAHVRKEFDVAMRMVMAAAVKLGAGYA